MEAPTLPTVKSPQRRFMREYAESPAALLGLAIVLMSALLAVFAVLIAPQNPYDMMHLSILDGMLPPGSQSGEMTFWLGTDEQGRDMLSALIYGFRVSLGVGVGSALFAGLVGTSLGVLAAYLGGRFDGILMRLVDLQLSLPSILIALVLLAILGRGVLNVMIALALVEWAHFARTARGAALGERNREYMEATVGLSLSHVRRIFGHLLPNCLAPVLVLTTILCARAITLEATLSFLGLGVPIDKPSLGLLISNGFDFMLSGQYWVSLYPGIVLVIMILGINLVGDRIRELLNPRYRL